MDFTALLVAASFYVLFGASVWRYLGHRDPVELAVVLVFACTAGLFGLSALSAVLPALAPYTGPIAVALLLAQPVTMVRLVRSYVGMPSWALPVAAAAAVFATILFFAAERSVTSVLVLVGTFACIETAVAARLVVEARRRHGFPRARLTTAAVASLLFGASILAAGVASAARGASGADPGILLGARVTALIAALGYLAAFVPPQWLRRIGHRALAFDLVQSIVGVPAGTEPRVLWEALAGTAVTILGARRVTIVTPGGAVASGTPEADARSATRRGDATPVEIRLEVDGRLVGTLVAELPGRPLFLEDDAALVTLLGSLTARAVERDEALEQVATAARAVAEAEAVRVSEARFRALLDAHPNAVLIVADDGRIQWGTALASAMFGIEHEELVGRRLDTLVARAAGRGLDEAVGRDVPGTSRYESLATTSTGRTFPVEVAATTLELDGERAHLIIVADITWRHESSAIRDRFIGVLSHELRTPITAIYGGTQLLLKRADLAVETRTEMLADVAAEAERLQRMVENLLVLARVEAEADVTDVGPVLLHRALPDVIDRERAMLPNLTLTADMPAFLPLVSADQGSISLVLRNLLSNAAKYGGDHADVRVAVSRAADGGVEVRVLDNGPGFDPADADNLFRLYFRAKATASSPGSGIGLFVSRQLVESMGGHMWAVNRPEGGSEFGFSLPAYTDAEDDAALLSERVRHRPPAAEMPAEPAEIPVDASAEPSAEIPGPVMGRLAGT